MGLVVFGDNLIRTWVGASYATTAPLGQVLAAHRSPASAAQIVILLAIPTMIALPQSSASSVLFGVSRHRGVVVLSILNALVNLGLSLLWVRPLGIAGVALGTAVPLALVGGLATMLFTCHALAIPFGRYAWEGLLRPGLCSALFLLPALAIQARWHPVGWWPLGCACLGSWMVFAAVAWRVALAPSERQRWSRTVPGLFRPRAAGAEAGR
jgi:O-antigen/teichoic acid export membrane protein